MARREFSKPVKAEIIKRAMQPNGEIACEGCGLILGKKPFHIDHVTADALVIDKSAKLTAKDGQLLGKACCHDPKTREHDVPAIAQAKRREAKHLGIAAPKQKITGRGFPSPKQKPAKPLPPRVRDVFGRALWHPIGGRDGD